MANQYSSIFFKAGGDKPVKGKFLRDGLRDKYKQNTDQPQTQNVKGEPAKEVLPVIGLEIHVQLKTRTKMFCTTPNVPDSTPANTAVCPICLGHPGTLPVVNKTAVEMVLKAGLALNCQVNKVTKFDRKNYFYPDLPKGYQISQYDAPLCQDGFLRIGERNIRIRRIHLEEDTGKLLHLQGNDYSLIDFNRAGTPLMELVTEPDIRSGEEAKEFCQELQLIFRYLDISDADMEKGQMRCEVNISLSSTLEEITDKENLVLGTKVEIKNLNSFKSVQRAIDYEIKRQLGLLQAGKKITQETRGWDEKRLVTVSQRGKEEAQDYRYFPEPDLPPLVIDQQWLREIKSQLPELPQAKRARFRQEYDLSYSEAFLLTSDRFLASFVEETISELKAWLASCGLFEGSEDEIWQEHKKKISHLVAGWLINKLGGLMAAAGSQVKDLKIKPEDFAELITLIFTNQISSTLAAQVLEKMFATGLDPHTIIEEENLQLIESQEELAVIIDEIIQSHPEEVAKYKKGKLELLQFFVGQAMRRTHGQAEPKKLAEIFRKKLSQDSS